MYSYVHPGSFNLAVVTNKEKHMIYGNTNKEAGSSLVSLAAVFLVSSCNTPPHKRLRTFKQHSLPPLQPITIRVTYVENSAHQSNLTIILFVSSWSLTLSKWRPLKKHLMLLVIHSVIHFHFLAQIRNKKLELGKLLRKEKMYDYKNGCLFLQRHSFPQGSIGCGISHGVLTVR